jgi:hypothetical protein
MSVAPMRFEIVRYLHQFSISRLERSNSEASVLTG